MRICSRCKVEKELTCFSKNKSQPSGLHNQCKDCHKAVWYGGLGERKKQERLNDLDARREKERAYANERYQSDIELSRKKTKEWREKNPEPYKRAGKKWRDKNKGYHADYIKKYKAVPENMEKIRDRRRKRAKDPQYIAYLSNQRRIRKALKDRGLVKSMSTLEATGCTRLFLVNYIESLFTEGMNQNNYGQAEGKWVVDHIKPVCSFDLSNPEELKKCFHYSNLRPYWAIKNAEKISEDVKLSIRKHLDKRRKQAPSENSIDKSADSSNLP